VGLGNYETTVPVYVYPGEPASIYAHNFFLQMAAEVGIPWLLLLSLLAMHWIKKNHKKLLQRENALFAALCILILFFNFFDVGNYFFAAGVCFAVAFSQIVSFAGRPWRPYLWPTLVFTAVLLVSEISVDRQNTADLWFVRRDYAKAEHDYLRALQINPFLYRALLGRAALAQKKDDPFAAEQIYGKILAIYPGQAYANFMASQAAYRRGAANKKNLEYQRWHEFIKTNLAHRLTLSGN
jgi:tetratricopeptide (TPR) repeat protein